MGKDTEMGKAQQRKRGWLHGCDAVGDAKESKAYAEGHRERLRAWYRQSGEASKQNYELLRCPPPSPSYLGGAGY